MQDRGSEGRALGIQAQHELVAIIHEAQWPNAAFKGTLVAGQGAAVLCIEYRTITDFIR